MLEEQIWINDETEFSETKESIDQRTREIEGQQRLFGVVQQMSNSFVSLATIRFFLSKSSANEQKTSRSAVPIEKNVTFIVWQCSDSLAQRFRRPLRTNAH